MVFKVLPKLLYEAAKEHSKEKKAYEQMVAQAAEEDTIATNVEES